jgi:hypothetical protein
MIGLYSIGVGVHIPTSSQNPASNLDSPKMGKIHPNQHKIIKKLYNKVEKPTFEKYMGHTPFSSALGRVGVPYGHVLGAKWLGTLLFSSWS